jgi:hypothetical protein
MAPDELVYLLVDIVSKNRITLPETLPGGHAYVLKIAGSVS